MMIRIDLESIRNNTYIILPIICIGLWAIFNLIHNIITINMLFIQNSDFRDYYEVTKDFAANPSNLYYMDIMYPHLPVLAVVMAVTICLLPFSIAMFTWYIFIYILALIFTIEYNKILKLLEVREKSVRLIFLMVISNGMIIYAQFYAGQFKYIIAVIYLYVIRREIQYRLDEKEKSLKYYLLSYNLLWFAVAIFPPALFVLLIYIFIDIKLANVLKKDSFKNYILVISTFAFQNFIIFIFPNLLIDFLGMYDRWNAYRGYIPLFYLREWVYLDDYSSIYLISNIFLVLVTLVLILRENLKLEEKLAYFSLYSIFSVYSGRALLIFLPIALLLYIPFLNQKEKVVDSIKQNKVIFFGLISVSLIYHMPPDFTIIKYVPLMQEFPYYIFLYLRFIFFL